MSGFTLHTRSSPFIPKKSKIKILALSNHMDIKSGQNGSRAPAWVCQKKTGPDVDQQRATTPSRSCEHRRVKGETEGLTPCSSLTSGSALRLDPEAGEVDGPAPEEGERFAEKCAAAAAAAAAPARLPLPLLTRMMLARPSCAVAQERGRPVGVDGRPVSLRSNN